MTKFLVAAPMLAAALSVVPFTALNAELAKIWKPIIERKSAPPDADEWKGVKGKLQHLQK